MGLFRKTAADEEAASEQMSPAEALAGVAVCAMYADGVLNADEDNELAIYLARLEAFRSLSDREMSAAFQRVHAIAAKEGDDALLTRCATALPDRLRPTAFLVACDLVMTDGAVGEEERGFLKRVQQRLAIEDGLAAKIVEVLAIKHLS